MKLVKLSEVCSFSRGLTYSKSDEVDYSSNIVLRANNIDLASNSLNLEDLRYIKDSIQIKKEKIAQKDSLIICTASGSKSHVGKVALIDEDYGYAFGGFMGQLTPSDICHPKFLYYIMTSGLFKEFLMSLNDGTNINNLKFSDIENYEIPLPSLEKQREIVEKLDSAFAEIEEMRTCVLAQRKVHLLLISEAIWNLLNDPNVKSINTTLDNICENLDSQRIPITRDVRTSGSYPYYGASGIIDYVEKYIFEGDALLVSEDGANLLARSTPIAFSVTGKYWVNNHAHILKFADQDLQNYVEYLLENTKLDEYITGAAQPKLTQRALNTIPIKIPINQADISSVSETISKLKQLTFLVTTNLDSKLELVDELKNAILGSHFGQQVA